MIFERKLPLSFSMSLGIHLCLLGGGSLLLVKPPQFGVDTGIASVEVQLVKAPQEPVEKIVEPIPEEIKEEVPEALPITKPEPVKEHTEEVKPPSIQGALIEARPDYLSNPAPAYPLEARRMKQEGIVILTADVDRMGNPEQINIKKSSGFSRLDQAAIKAVWKWKFSPAKIGDLPVNSTVEIPVRFLLKDS